MAEMKVIDGIDITWKCAKVIGNEVLSPENSGGPPILKRGWRFYSSSFGHPPARLGTCVLPSSPPGVLSEWPTYPSMVIAEWMWET